MKRTIKLNESELKRIISESVKRVLKEGWVRNETESTEDIFNSIINTFKSKEDLESRALRSEGGSVYEYLTDYIRDYYNVTLKQCDELCNMIKKYNSPHFSDNRIDSPFFGQYALHV